MNPSYPNNEPQFQPQQPDQSLLGFDINYQRIIARCLKYWYVFLLTIVTALSIAYMINRYSTRIYPVSASIMIKENQEMSEAEFIIKNSLITSYRNYFNEIHIIKSYPLLESVVRELNYQVSYYNEGNLKTSESYAAELPIRLEMLPSDHMPYGKKLGLTIVDEQEFKLEYLNDEGESKDQVITGLKFNDTLRINGYKLLVKITKPGKITENKGKYFIIQLNDPFKVAQSYSTRLGAKWAEEGASVVNLSLTGAVPPKEIDFINTFIQKYQLYDVNKKNQVAIKSLEFLDKQLMIIGDSLRFFEDQIESFKRNNVVTSLDAQAQRLYSRLEELESTKVKQTLQENYYKYIVERLSIENYEGIITPQTVGIDDPVIAKLIADLIAAQAEIRMFIDVEKLDQNPIVQDRKRKIIQTKDQIINAINSARDARKADEKLLNEQIKTLERQLDKLPGAERALVKIQRNYKLREGLYVFLMQKRAEVGISRASATSSIIVVNSPTVGVQIAPKTKLNYLLALSFGTVLPIALFILLELLNTRIQAKEDIEQLTQVPVTGGVGHNPVESNLIVFQKPRSAVAEAFRALRSNLNYYTQGKEKKIFLITSSIAGEGKTFSSINLATVLAMSGKKTIIVGADLRRPKLFDDFKVDNAIGLSQYLSDMATIEEIVRETEVENLDLISGGPVPPNPSELLMRPQMDRLIEILKLNYDYIILDTPPVGLVTDAFVLNKYADHTLYVVRQDFTPKEALSALDETYRVGRLKNLSILFNDIRKNGPGYGYGYQYGYGYGYGYGSKKKQSGGYYEE